MSTTFTAYPHSPYAPGMPTASDPPIAVPQTVPDTDYVKAKLTDSEILTFPADPAAYTDTAIEGIADNLVGLVITMTFGPYSEVAYQLGAFTTYYAAGSTINLTTGAYSLKRDHGFPSDAVVQVIAAPAIPTGGQTWGAIYQVDLTAQATQSMTAAGSYTIDGKAWWAKGTLWSGGVNGLVNGSGLQLFAPATIGGSQPDRPNFRTVTTGISQRVLFFPFAQLTDYNANAPVYVLWRMSGTLSGDSDRCYSAGLMSAASTASPLADAERGLCVQVCHFAKNTSNPIWAGVAGNQAPLSSLINDADLSHYQTGVLRFAQQRFYVLGAPYSGTEVSPESSALNLSGGGCLIETGTQSALGFYLTLHKAFSDGQTLDVYLTHLSVCQPKVP